LQKDSQKINGGEMYEVTSKATGKLYRLLVYPRATLNDNFENINKAMKDLNCRYILYYYHDYEEGSNRRVFVFENWEKSLRDLLNNKAK
jgi:hypothetical protein